MCLAGNGPPARTGSDAAARADALLGCLATEDAGGLTTAEQAECLLSLERAESRLTAARASILTAFSAQGGYEHDGHGSVRTWLAWQARTTRSAAAVSVGWARRLAAHPAVHSELAAGTISVSWARQICEWTDRLPPQHRQDADVILLDAAAAGADLSDLAGLAEEMHRKTAEPDRDGDDDFTDRWMRLTRHWRGGAKLDGELTPQAAAALAAVLEALGKKAGPEDTRTQAQRDHDAIEEACRRLVGSGCMPDRAGQPTHIQLFMTLDQLRDQSRGSAGPGQADPADPASWPAHGLPLAGPGAECDATIIPIVTGHVDPAKLEQLTRSWLDSIGTGVGQASPGLGGRDPAGAEPPELSQAGMTLLRDTLLRYAADLLSGPTGLAAWLRTGLLSGPAGSVSLPLDIGTATDTIPADLRRAVAVRDRGCRFPGCDQPPAACQPHHIIHRSDGGATSLANLLSLCSFHHLIAVHRWGWLVALHGDGTVTATSPDRNKVLTSHGPPGGEPPGQEPPGRAA
jgi:hypothetical protein